MILGQKHRVKNAVRFKRDCGSSTWLVLGKSTAWPDDNAPPNPAVSDTISGAIGAAQATVYLVKEDASGTLIYKSNGVTRKFLEYGSISAAIADNCQLVLLTAEVEGQDLIDLSVASFRQVGFSTNLTPAAGHESDAFVANANVTTYGELETLENRKPVSLIGSSTYTVSAILEF